MRVLIGSALVLWLATSMPMAQAPRPGAKPLTIYFIDTEGGQATLFISPSGETLMVDSGNVGTRDPDRIRLAMADAGVTQIDHLLFTHYHNDHVGGSMDLARNVPIKHFYDHGPSVEARESAPGFLAAYAEMYGNGKATHTVLKPGDKVPFAGVDWQIVAAATQVLKTNMAGAPGAGKPNPYCADAYLKVERATDENGQSTASVMAFGKFRMVDFGDLLWNVEHELFCPINHIGTVDLYLTTHHGLDLSNSKAAVYALQPRVILMNNGTRKGGNTEPFQTFESSPNLEDLWQLHWSYEGGVEHNTPGRFIANVESPADASSIILNPVPPKAPGAPAPPGGALIPAPAPGAAPAGRAAGAPGAGRGGAGGRGVQTPEQIAAAAAIAKAEAHAPAYWLKVTAQTDGSFTIANPRNGFSKTYKPRS